MQGKKAVIFDVYKTLIDIKTDEKNPAAWKGFSNWLGSKGIYIGAGELERVYSQEILSDLASNPESYPDIEIGQIFARIFQRRDIVEEAASRFRSLTTVSIDIYPDIKYVLETLAKTTRLAVISNARGSLPCPNLSGSI